MASKKDNNFLNKLYKILSSSAFTHVINWTESQPGFEITDQFEFAAEVLPKFFKHSNISSFIRQLNMYGFRKVKKSNKAMQFVHDTFDRDWQNGEAVIPRRTTEVKVFENGVKEGKQKVKKMVKDISKLKERQAALEDHIKNLETRNQDIKNFNNVLELEIFNSKQREREITNVLSVLGSYLKSTPRRSWNMVNVYNNMLKDLDIPIEQNQISESAMIPLPDFVPDVNDLLMLPEPNPEDLS